MLGRTRSGRKLRRSKRREKKEKSSEKEMIRECLARTIRTANRVI
jgi:hypothetical protein